MLESAPTERSPIVHVPRVKICGITRLADAWLAIDAGVDALGFLVGLDYPSGDELEPGAARRLVARLPPLVSPVLVTHRKTLPEVLALCAEVAPHVVQLHGHFPLLEIPVLRRLHPHLKLVKAVHVDGESAIAFAVEAARWADALLLDTRTATRIGGTGQTHDWSISRRIREAVAPTPILLAGGLRPENLAAAIERVGPYGVDVNTGVSLAPGEKSPDAVRRFVQIAKARALEPAAAR